MRVGQIGAVDEDVELRSRLHVDHQAQGLDDGHGHQCGEAAIDAEGAGCEGRAEEILERVVAETHRRGVVPQRRFQRIHHQLGFKLQRHARTNVLLILLALVVSVVPYCLEAVGRVGDLHDEGNLKHDAVASSAGVRLLILFHTGQADQPVPLQHLDVLPIRAEGLGLVHLPLRPPPPLRRLRPRRRLHRSGRIHNEGLQGRHSLRRIQQRRQEHLLVG
mmetsp:Transcript_17299/g.65934  ORF Transcript_17299/g.65934 Transcript_17299/m.65934 type:complete len:219 (-) Transcript_17299:265-921(-)